MNESKKKVSRTDILRELVSIKTKLETVQKTGNYEDDLVVASVKSRIKQLIEVV